MKKKTSGAAKKPVGGLAPNVVAAVVYLLQVIPVVGLVAALVAYAMRKDEFVRHNAVQAFFLSFFFTVTAIVLARASLSALLPLLSLAVVAAFAFAAFKSYKGERLVLPFVQQVAA